MEGGWDLAQTIEYSRELKQRGADWVTASSGGISPLQKIKVGSWLTPVMRQHSASISVKGHEEQKALPSVNGRFEPPTSQHSMRSKGDNGDRYTFCR
jgi:hypothetical protein